jgi:hypothetical protein
MSTPLTEKADTLRFRGPTIEAALDAAQTSLGGKVQLLAANRLRRGGIGGFFAADMGVEVSVSLEHESIEEALQRLVEGTAAEEREEWRRLVASSPVAAPSASASTVAAEPASFEAVAAHVDSAMHGPGAEPGHQPEPEFIEFPPVQMQTVRVPPAQVTEIVTAPPAAVPVEQPLPVAKQPAAPKASPTMLRKHVELAVAAADQLIEGLTHTPNVKSITAHVIVRSVGQYDVEMDVRWESHGEATS